MEIDPKLAVIGKLFDEVLNAGSFDGVEEFLASGMEYQGPTTSTTSRQEFLDWVNTVRRGWSDFSIVRKRDQLTAHTVTVDFDMSGVHSADFLGVPATHRKFTVKGRAVVRFRGGKIVSIDAAYDTNALLEQLGVKSNSSSKSTLPPTKQPLRF